MFRLVEDTYDIDKDGEHGLLEPAGPGCNCVSLRRTGNYPADCCRKNLPSGGIPMTQRGRNDRAKHRQPRRNANDNPRQCGETRLARIVRLGPPPFPPRTPSLPEQHFSHSGDSALVLSVLHSGFLLWLSVRSLNSWALARYVCAHGMPTRKLRRHWVWHTCSGPLASRFWLE